MYSRMEASLTRHRESSKPGGRGERGYTVRRLQGLDSSHLPVQGQSAARQIVIPTMNGRRKGEACLITFSSLDEETGLVYRCVVVHAN